MFLRKTIVILESPGHALHSLGPIVSDSINGNDLPGAMSETRQYQNSLVCLHKAFSCMPPF